MKTISYYFRFFIQIIVCMQLMLYPAWSFSAEEGSSTRGDASASSGADFQKGNINKYINRANDFNSQVESLYENIFGSRESSDYYRNHPLDMYSLVNQEVKPYDYRQPLFRRGVKGDLQKPYPRQISLEQIFIEVLNTEGEVEAVLHNRGDSALMSKEGGNSLYAGPAYVPGDGKQTFRIKHRGQVLHSFPFHINWVSVFNNYLVFMEPSQVYEQKGKALISFIDLSVFQPALGKTALPVFRIPAIADTTQKQEILLEPEAVSIEDLVSKTDSEDRRKVLKVGSSNRQFSISYEELEKLSRIQQLAFNAQVSILDIKRYESDVIPFVRDISDKVEELLQRGVQLENTDGQNQNREESYKIMQEMISRGLHTRLGIGSAEDRAGVYTQWRDSEHYLSLHEKDLTEDQKKAYESFISSLTMDTDFQKAVAQVSTAQSYKKKIMERLKGLYLYLTMPQPLGASRILEGLGAIAGSLRPGETVTSRSTLMLEGMRQLGSNKRFRFSTALLAGAVSAAVPEVRDFYMWTFSTFQQWLINWKEILVDTSAKGFSFINWHNVQEAYFSSKTFGPFMIGTGAVAVSLLALFLTPHFVTNIVEFVKYYKSSKFGEHIKSLKQVFIDFEQKIQDNFYNDLSNMEKRRVGLPIDLRFQNQQVVKGLFQLGKRWADVLKGYVDTNTSIDWFINIHDPETRRIATSVKLTSFAENIGLDNITSGGQPSIRLVLRPAENESYSREFILVEGVFSELFTEIEGRTHLIENLSMELQGIKGVSDFVFAYSGDIKDANFSKEDKKRLKTSLQNIKNEKSWFKKVFNKVFQRQSESSTAAEQTDILSIKQIHHAGQAFMNIFSYANWANTFSVMAFLWNEWFLYRSFIIAPRTGVRALWYNNYFDRIYTKRHRATRFNGAHTSRLEALWDWADNQVKKKSGREYLSALKDFEKEIISIERMYMRTAAEQAYLLALDMYMEDPKGEKKLENVIKTGVEQTGGDKTQYGLKEDNKSAYVLDLSRLKKKDKWSFELFQRMLFKEAMREFVKEQLGISGEKLSDRQIRRKVIQHFSQGGSLTLKQESLSKARNRVQVLAENLNLKDKVSSVMQKFYRALPEKLSAKRERVAEKFLNPNNNTQMETYEIVNQGLKDPESIARAVRLELNRMKYDIPIGFVLTLLVLAGADYGLLQIVHEERFSEEAFFHLSRYAIWAGFVTGVVMGFLSNVWWKIQEDARLAVGGGFDNIPEKKDVDKKISSLRWYWKQFIHKENNFLGHYKYIGRRIWSNVPGFFVNFGLIVWPLTLGRFDIDLFIVGYLISVLTGFIAFDIKLDQSYERFANFSLKNFIRQGFDFNGKDKRFLYHPAVIKEKVRVSDKHRRNFNLLKVIFWQSIFGNIVEIFQTVPSKDGSFAVMRQFFFKNTLTDYWVKATNSLQELGVPGRVVNICQKAFTNNRVDLPGE